MHPSSLKLLFLETLVLQIPGGHCQVEIPVSLPLLQSGPLLWQIPRLVRSALVVVTGRLFYTGRQWLQFGFCVALR